MDYQNLNGSQIQIEDLVALIDAYDHPSHGRLWRMRLVTSEGNMEIETPVSRSNLKNPKGQARYHVVCLESLIRVARKVAEQIDRNTKDPSNDQRV